MVQVHDLGDHLVSNIPFFVFHNFTVLVSLEVYTSARSKHPTKHQTHCRRGGNTTFRVHKARAQNCVVWSGAENFASPLEPAAAHTAGPLIFLHRGKFSIQYVILNSALSTRIIFFLNYAMP